jgi:hypothetical protein
MISLVTIDAKMGLGLAKEYKTALTWLDIVAILLETLSMALLR